MERKLLLLGLLRAQDMHGYQLNEIIDSHLGTSIQLKRATAYDLLKRMTDEGWITFHEEREGNRPPRRVYAITPEGEHAFQQMLRQGLAAYQPAQFPSDIALAFLDTLPKEEALTLLGERRVTVDELRQDAADQSEHPGSMQLMIEHQQRHLAAELTWLDEVIERIKQQESN